MRKRFLHDKYSLNEEFWDKNWDGDWQKKIMASPTILPRLVACIQKYLAPGMLLLEGGCGDGRYVRYFSDLDIKTIGVDFAQGTVRKINECFPNLDVRIGDIRKLDFPDSHFDAYYSGGVIEHFEDGVAPQLAEAHRVLKAGGYFFVTVPHMNLIRRCTAVFSPTREKIDLDGRTSFHKEGLHAFQVEQPPVGFHFHEYVFSTSEMRSYLSNAGFMIVDEECFSSTHGLCDIEFYRKLVAPNRLKRTIVNRLFAIPLRLFRFIEDGEFLFSGILSGAVGSIFGNLKLYVCRVEK